jgi:hypothetical protein
MKGVVRRVGKGKVGRRAVRKERMVGDTERHGKTPAYLLLLPFEAQPHCFFLLHAALINIPASQEVWRLLGLNETVG